MSDADFVSEQLSAIRRTFFAKISEKQFFQEKNMLLQAIAFPAAHLKERYGVNASGSLYRRILKTVIETIVAKGNRAKIERFSAYFLHCVQTHMQHHGEEYYEAAKAARSAADMLPAAMRGAHIVKADVTTQSLAELHRMLKSRGGRKKRPAPAQPTLF
jgi:uncharacterized protein YjaG (DUF416 family)